MRSGRALSRRERAGRSLARQLLSAAQQLPAGSSWRCPKLHRTDVRAARARSCRGRAAIGAPGTKADPLAKRQAKVQGRVRSAGQDPRGSRQECHAAQFKERRTLKERVARDRVRPSSNAAQLKWGARLRATRRSGGPARDTAELVPPIRR